MNSAAPEHAPSIRSISMSAAVSGALAVLWLYGRMSPGVAFTQWQGPMLHADTPENVPMLSRGLAQLTLHFFRDNPLYVLNLVSVILTAAACGMVAVITTSLCASIAQGYAAPLLGLLSATLLLTSSPLTAAGTAVSPAPLNLLVALISLSLILLETRDQKWPWTLAGGAFAAGIAASNHPALAWLLAPALVLALTPNRAGQVRWRRLVWPLCAFAAGAAPPALKALWGEESLAGFLSHALRTPYPALWEGTPSLNYGEILLEAYPLPPLILAFAAAILAYVRGGRRQLFVLGAVFLFLGPFLPSLTNHYGSSTALHDTQSALLIVLAVVATGAGVGAAYLIRQSKSAAGRSLLVMLAVTGAAALVWKQWDTAPNRRHGLALDLGRAILEGCGENATVVAGDERLASILQATQVETGEFGGLTVFRLAGLLEAGQRLRIAEMMGKPVRLSARPDSSEQQLHWEVERPHTYLSFKEAIAAGSNPDTPLQELALWDLVRDNFLYRRFYFAGVDLPWLNARARRAGWTLTYPDPAPADPGDVSGLVERFTQGRLAGHDPEVSGVFAQLLAPLAKQAMKRDDLEEASRIARDMTLAAPGESQTRLTLIRLAARQGQAEAAKRHAEDYLIHLSPSERPADVVQLLDEGLLAAALASQLRALMTHPTLDQAQTEAFDELTKRLWGFDELSLLVWGYEAMLSRGPASQTLYFDYAAALAQLGDLQGSARQLRKWSQRVQLSPQAINRTLEQDGRFRLVRDITFIH